MADAIRIEAGELTSEEVMDALNEGKRVIIKVSVAGITLDMSIRRRSGRTTTIRR